MTEAELCLYVDDQLASPYAMSVFVALTEKNVPFDMRRLDLEAEAQHAPDFAALSLTRRVPALVHAGFALSESTAIAEYLDEVFPGTPLYPQAARERARARQVQAWLRSDLMPIREERSTMVVFYGQVAPPLSAMAQAAVRKLYAAADALLAPGATTLFAEWSLADVDLALMLNRLQLNGDPVPERLAHYARRQWLRPSVQQWVQLPRTSRSAPADA
ncbi:glutathione transferase [Paludibacterium yongneupense]|uniref:glutathione transferase n=1 Tax=Paludibacterium yongneupense TaxID=400061 RepID=UPI00040BC73B|nr:glutathione transferase [Paludibacterium yongneupense]